MPFISNIDNKIIAASVNSRDLVNKKERQENKTKNLLSSPVLYLGASALASIAIAGLLIGENRKRIKGNILNNTKKVLSINDLQVSKLNVKNQQEKKRISKIVDLIIPFNEKDYEAVRKKEAIMKADLSERFASGKAGDLQNAEYFELRENQILKSYLSPISPDRKLLSKENLESILSFLKDSKLNAKLRGGLDLSDDENVKIIDNLINESKPLDEHSIVYSFLRTKKTYDSNEDLDFVKDLKLGNILKDKGFILSSRKYDTYLAQSDAVIYNEKYNDSRYILRIVLPKGTKGFDGRRCTGREDGDKINSTFILPRNSELKIRRIDDSIRLIDVDYLLPKN